MHIPDEFEIYPLMARALIDLLPTTWTTATLVLSPASDSTGQGLAHTIIGPTGHTTLQPSPQLYFCSRQLQQYFSVNPPMFEEARLTVEQTSDGKWRHRTALRYPAGSWDG